MTKAERIFIQDNGYHNGYRGVKCIQANGLLIWFGVVYCPMCAGECAFSNFDDAFDFIEKYKYQCPLVENVYVHEGIQDAYIDASYGKDGARLYSDISTHKLFVTYPGLAGLLERKIHNRV